MHLPFDDLQDRSRDALLHGFSFSACASAPRSARGRKRGPGRWRRARGFLEPSVVDRLQVRPQRLGLRPEASREDSDDIRLGRLATCPRAAPRDALATALATALSVSSSIDLPQQRRSRLQHGLVTSQPLEQPWVIILQPGEEMRHHAQVLPLLRRAHPARSARGIHPGYGSIGPSSTDRGTSGISPMSPAASSSAAGIFHSSTTLHSRGSSSSPPRCG